MLAALSQMVDGLFLLHVVFFSQKARWGLFKWPLSKIPGEGKEGNKAFQSLGLELIYFLLPTILAKKLQMEQTQGVEK